MAFIGVSSSLLLLALLLVPQLMGDFFAYQLGLYLIYGIVAQGIGFVWGKTGVLPFGQALFFGVTAYFSAAILGHVDGIGVQLLLLVGAVLFVTIIAFTLAYLVFKGRSESGPYFSLITLALVMAAEQIAGTATGLTGGFNGSSGFGVIGNLDQFGSLYYLIVAVCVLVTVGLLLLEKLPVDLVARAVTDNEPRLQLLGYKTHVIKALAFGFSALLAGIAGILFASHQGIVTPTSTGFLLSASFVIWTAVGGRFHVFGPLLGAVLIGLASSEFRDSFKLWDVLIACIFILVVVRAPGGFIELLTSLRTFIASKQTAGADTLLGIPAPPLKTVAITGKLSFSSVRLSAGPVNILNGVDFDAPENGIICIIGPNGAGKTTLFNAITGNLHPQQGDISIGLQHINGHPPYRAMSRGLGRKLQVPSVFSSLTVQQNLGLSIMAGRASLVDYFCRKTLNWQTDYSRRLLQDPRLPLHAEPSKKAGGLPQGHRQFLEFAMTTIPQPRILLLDEPCAGLSPHETALMTELARDFQAEFAGLVVIIEHDMSIVEKLSDQVLVLHQGQVLATGDYHAIQQNLSVQAIYAGGSK